jgi:predicted transcriptional regulator of viral defense system
MATKIQKPSYISLQSALSFHGMNFQYDETIYVIGYKSEEIMVDGKKLSFRVLKKAVRENFSGIISDKGYAIASKERAMLDTLYLYKDYFFDNLEGVDWNKLKELTKIYGSKILEKRVETLYTNHMNHEYYSEIR